jgi:signal recognition particle receptor subunit beta
MHQKFIFTGTPGVGKTTTIAAISEIPPISTEMATTDNLSEIKEKTTVALDYGQMTLEDGQVIGLYGTPGQQRFSFMWEIIVQGGLGLIILIDNSRADPLADLKLYLDNFAGFISETAVVIGITRANETMAPELDDYIEFLVQHGNVYPVFEVDIRQRDDVLILMDALLSCLEYDDRED